MGTVFPEGTVPIYSHIIHTFAALMSLCAFPVLADQQSQSAIYMQHRPHQVLCYQHSGSAAAIQMYQLACLSQLPSAVAAAAAAATVVAAAAAAAFVAVAAAVAAPVVAVVAFPAAASVTAAGAAPLPPSVV